MKKESIKKITILFCRDKYEALETQKLRLADYTRIVKTEDFTFDYYIERVDCGETLERWTLKNLMTRIMKDEISRIVVTDIFQFSCHSNVQSELKMFLVKNNIEFIDLSEL
jgi:hypothetical protein